MALLETVTYKELTIKNVQSWTFTSRIDNWLKDNLGEYILKKEDNHYGPDTYRLREDAPIDIEVFRKVEADIEAEAKAADEASNAKYAAMEATGKELDAALEAEGIEFVSAVWSADPVDDIHATVVEGTIFHSVNKETRKLENPSTLDLYREFNATMDEHYPFLEGWHFENIGPDKFIIFTSGS